jgi:hypothetical protein
VKSELTRKRHENRRTIWEEGDQQQEEEEEEDRDGTGE